MFGMNSVAVFKDRGFDYLKEGRCKVWDGEDWVEGNANLHRNRQYKLHLSDGSFIECSPFQEFLTSFGWVPAELLKRRGIYLGSVVDGLEVPFDYKLSKLNCLDRYDLGVLYGRIQDAYLREGTLIFKLKEKDYDLVREFSEIIEKVSNFVSYPEFSYWGNRVVFECSDLAWLKKNCVPREAFLSKNFARGYLRAVFDQSSLVGKELKLKGYKHYLKDIRELLKLFNVRTRLDKGLFVRDLDTFFFSISTLSETLMSRIEKVWDGYQRAPVNKGKLTVVKISKSKKYFPLWELTTESGKVIINGVVSYATR